jgi:hypothetical protein
MPLKWLLASGVGFVIGWLAAFRFIDHMLKEND